ncbi:domain of unknown function DUF1737 [Beutenbergia cavernae DSM 12333]|uniref:DUF1737 domain-containing protein n=1 Tax=Beutenbergia cavernae (strain ATCC BAA-8 / DSM 12333 / CCUG 43141 / JCM 11478 / NBRC 16432 / NCIMB 13614 / HKI 0122) TaxID=471853 RepID=C5BX99_BEUC1|nr:domain of unknown function DUF1737 [Beutenbergia cavernae DSM 12333]
MTERTTDAPPPPSGDQSARRRYRLLTGPDDGSFCDRVSAALDEGYVLHGSPAATFDGAQVIVAQAVVLPAAPSAQVRPA